MDKEVIITYESLYELLRREKSRPELQQLNEDFFKDILKYLEDKKAILNSQEKKDSIFNLEVEKTKKQLENIKKIIKDLYERREFKIIQLATISSRTKNDNYNLNAFLPEEKTIYAELIKCLDISRDNILTNILNYKLPSKTRHVEELKPKVINMDSKKEENKLIRILNPLPKFIGTDLEVYGPFDQENIVNLPSQIANLLINTKKAEEIKI